MRVVVMGMTLLLAACGDGAPPPAASVPATEPGQTAKSEDPAADLVRNFGLGSNLEQMAITVATGTQTSAMLPRERVVAEVRRLVPQYQSRWDANLASAHAAHLSQEELRSLASKGRRSPHYGKLEEKKLAISADMKEMSSPLLQQLVSEALKGAVGSEPSAQEGTVDMPFFGVGGLQYTTGNYRHEISERFPGVHPTMFLILAHDASNPALIRQMSILDTLDAEALQDMFVVGLSSSASKEGYWMEAEDADALLEDGADFKFMAIGDEGEVCFTSRKVVEKAQLLASGNVLAPAFSRCTAQRD